MAKFARMGLVLAVLAFQLHILTMAAAKLHYRVSALQGPASKDNAVQAFLIIAYLLFTAAFVLALLVNFSELRDNRMATVATAVISFVAVVSVIIGLAIHGSALQSGTSAYTTTTYVTGAASGLAAGVLFILS